MNDRPGRSLTTAALLILSTCSPASAFTFAQVNDGFDQSLNWFWEYQGTSFHSCLTSTIPCGNNIFATQGRIPLQGFSTIELKTGGMLDWTASSGVLKVVAMPRVAAHPLGASMVWGSAWAAIDVRGAPLDFIVVGEAGDPSPLDLLIRPRLLGSVEHWSYVGGSEATLFLQVEMSVRVNGQLVSQDTLTREYVRSDGQQTNYSLAFPKGGANSVIVPGITNGSLISISMWAYQRATASAPAFVNVYTSYGDGPAIEIDVRSASAVAVEDEPAPAALSLAASPNPSRGSARITCTLPRPAGVRLSIYDIGGHRVATLRDRWEAAGRGEVSWDGRTDRGQPVAAGIYVMELVAGAERRVQRLVMLGAR